MQRHIAPPASYLLQCVDVNSISLYDSDVRGENFVTLRVLLWKKLLAQDLQNLTEIKEISWSEGFQRREVWAWACFEMSFK